MISQARRRTTSAVSLVQESIPTWKASLPSGRSFRELRKDMVAVYLQEAAEISTRKPETYASVNQSTSQAVRSIPPSVIRIFSPEIKSTNSPDNPGTKTLEPRSETD